MNYTNHRHNLSSNQLGNQLDQLEELKAKRRASLALDTDPDFPSFVDVEMKCRVMDAIWKIDLADEPKPPLSATEDGPERYKMNGVY